MGNGRFSFRKPSKPAQTYSLVVRWKPSPPTVFKCNRSTRSVFFVWTKRLKTRLDPIHRQSAFTCMHQGLLCHIAGFSPCKQTSADTLFVRVFQNDYSTHTCDPAISTRYHQCCTDRSANLCKFYAFIVLHFRDQVKVFPQRYPYQNQGYRFTRSLVINV